MSALKKHRTYAAKKNDGQEAKLDFEYLARKDISTVEIIRVEVWVKERVSNLLTEFKMHFPELL